MASRTISSSTLCESSRFLKALGELNYIHPFREGNGRTQRVFIEELGRETGHDVNFRGITRERMIAASIEVHQDPASDAMRHVLRDSVEPNRVEALLQVQDMPRRADIDPNERYVVSARDGDANASVHLLPLPYLYQIFMRLNVVINR